MRNLLILAALSAAAAGASGCAYQASSTNLKEVAGNVGFKSITTGDGTFENYEAIGRYKGREIGFAVGLPILFKIKELLPAQSNEGLLEQVAQSAKEAGANAMINVEPHREIYLGFPFFFAGLYIDTAEGTGIKAK